jgi:hypothetical protein
MGSFERFKSYEAWKANLEERLALHLFFQDGERRADNFNIEETTGVVVHIDKKRVEVKENPLRRGVWMVFVNGVDVGSFIGPLAQMKATRLAGKLLNED